MFLPSQEPGGNPYTLRTNASTGLNKLNMVISTVHGPRTTLHKQARTSGFGLHTVSAPIGSEKALQSTGSNEPSRNFMNGLC